MKCPCVDVTLMSDNVTLHISLLSCYCKILNFTSSMSERKTNNMSSTTTFLSCVVCVILDNLIGIYLSVS